MYSLTKLMVSHDLLRSTVTNQITLDQRDSNMFPRFERTMNHCCQALVSKLETLDAITFICIYIYKYIYIQAYIYDLRKVTARSPGCYLDYAVICLESRWCFGSDMSLT